MTRDVVARIVRICFLFLLPWAAPARADGIFRLGPVQPLNVASAIEQQSPVLSCAEGDSFVATWTEPDADSWGVAARTFASSGAPTSAVLPVNAVTVGAQLSSDVARDGAGNFVVVWRDQTAEGGANSNGIRARLYSAAGVGGTEFSVNSYLPGQQATPDVARSSAGSFVVVWEGEGPGALDGIWFRRFDAAGVPQGIETFVSAGHVPKVALNPVTGGFVIAWSFINGANSYDVRARRFDALGNPLGAVLEVNSSISGIQDWASIAADAAGNFVVLFEGAGQGDTEGLLGQLYSAAGVPVGTEFWVNATIAGSQIEPHAAFDGTGGFLVTWTGIAAASGRTFAAYFSPLAIRFGGTDFPLTATIATDHDQLSSRICRDGTRTFRTAYLEYDGVGNNSDLYSQRLTFALFADGFESGNTSAWSL